MAEQKNIILAIVLSLLIILGFQYFVEAPRVAEEQKRLDALREQQELQQAQGDSVVPAPQPGTAGVSVPGTVGLQSQQKSIGEVLSEEARVQIDNGRLHGSVSLKGARLDDLTLVDYRETVDPTSPEVRLLNPAGSSDAYFVELGWVSQNQDVKVPNSETIWASSAETIKSGEPVTLSFDNGAGLVFENTVSVDENYLFSYDRKVTNNTEEPVVLYPYGLISRTGTPKTSGIWILHEGPIGGLNGTLEEVDYSTLVDDGEIKHQTQGGWLGITDKYWLTSLIPRQEEQLEATYRYSPQGGVERFQVDFFWQPRSVAPGETISVEQRVFAGAKEISLIDAYRVEYSLPVFDKAVDFGWFYFLTKPILYVLKFFYGLVGNYGVAILLLTLAVKLVFFPLANKSYKSMSQMKKLQPEMQKLRERYDDDKQKLQQEMMALYKKEKVNPLSGCLPIFVQIPVFFSLYKVLFVAIEMRHAPFFGWIQDLSAPDPTSLLNLFGLLPFDTPLALTIGIWPIAMGVSMWMQQKLNPQPADPVQAKVMMFLPVLFTVMLAQFAAGLVIYWTWNNILSMAQQWFIMRKMGVHVDGTVDKEVERAAKEEEKKAREKSSGN